MKELLAIMANLMSNGTHGPAEVGFNAMNKLVDLIPAQAFDLLLKERKA